MSQQLTVKKKLYGLAVLMTGAIFLLLGIVFYFFTQYQLLNSTMLTLSSIKANVLELRRSEKDFLARIDLKYEAKFTAKVQETLVKQKTLYNQTKQLGLEQSLLVEFDQKMAEYQQSFTALVNMQKRIGMDEKTGYYGSLRDAVHGVESIVMEIQKDNILAGVLMLRRREKDFMLRSNIKYVVSFKKDMAKLVAVVNASNLKETDQLKSLLQVYERQFEAYTQGAEEKGLDSKSGIMGEMRKAVHSTEASLTGMQEMIQSAIQRRQSTMMTQVAAISLALILLILSIILYIVRGINLSMGRFIVDLTSASDQLVSASSEISSSAQQVASGATEQASSLEETSSAMEEVAAQAQGNTDHANEAVSTVQEMNDLVQQANQKSVETEKLAIESQQAAANGADSMKQISSAMKEIQTSSDQISDIIEVINEITHQTKMLATNAAIEAARAGEQGKGFAVVADEVSKLAENSKSSAKEISSLIKESVQKSKRGAEFVDRGDEALQGILGITTEMTGLIGEISESSAAQSSKMTMVQDVIQRIGTASMEQASGIGEVNGAITEMDKVTQTNAANSEESASAAEELNAQATQLLDLVGKIGDHFGINSTLVQRKSKGVAEPVPRDNFVALPSPTKTRPRQITPSEVIPMRDEFKDF
ncbi:MAG: methyl-accepting chemotaxis protein [SAR324 cluster bacterium]|nr:methyl-accepting chemotaxis protein [SAR324 cluster bacterium]